MYQLFSRGRSPGKAVLTLLLSLTAIVLFIRNPCAPRLFCAIAMGLSSIGDFCLMYRPEKKEPPPLSFLIGAVFFLLAHISYILAYMSAMRFTLPALNTGAVIGCLLLLTGMSSMLMFKKRNPQPLFRAGGLVYLLMISINCFVISTYAFEQGGIRLLCSLGAVSFFISDYLIGARIFSDIAFFQSNTAKEAVWWFYPIGQFLMIVFIM